MKDYLDAVAASLSASFSNTERIRKFTSNTDVLGAYAETVVNEFLRTIVSPLRVSSGTIITPERYQDGSDLPQIDTILWDPNPLPAIFAVDGFGLVPRNSVVGALEIKRTDYSNGLDDIEARRNDTKQLLPREAPNFLAVICIRTHHAKEGDNKLAKLLKTGECCYLIDLQDAQIKVNPEGIFQLINFLAKCRKTHKERNAEFNVDYPKQ